MDAENAPSTRFRQALDHLYMMSGLLGATFIAMIFLLVLGQVSLNAIDRISGLLMGSAIGLTIPSYADFTGFFLAAASFLALAYTLRQGEHIRVTLFLSHLSDRVRRWFEVWCLAVTSALTLYFTWYTLLLVRDSYSYHDLSSGMIAVPIWIPQLAMFLGLLVLAIALLDSLFMSLFGHSTVSKES
ncbi:MAG: TRAP transporter small permease [Desulfuromusa sp.]|nr:TRAP transporter small permease [Desulfuromusa sp.]